MRNCLSGLAALVLAATTVAAQPGDQVECRIEASNGNGGPRLVAVARMPAEARAQWRFEVRSTGRGGTSSTVQDGGGNLPGGRWVLLGEVHTYDAASYEATLTLSSPEGEVRCRRADPEKAGSGRWPGKSTAFQESRGLHAGTPFGLAGMHR